MRRVITLTFMLATSGCSTYQVWTDCTRQAGPEPSQGLVFLGLVGAAIVATDPAHGAWEDRRNACVDGRLHNRG